MDPIEKRNRIATLVFDYGRAIAPGRFPAEITPGHIEAWGEILGEIDLPDYLWHQAVKLWAKEDASRKHKSQATAYEVLNAARQARNQWELTDEGRALMQQWRDSKRDKREQLWREGQLKPLRTTAAGQLAAQHHPNAAIEAPQTAKPDMGRVEAMIQAAFSKKRGNLHG